MALCINTKHPDYIKLENSTSISPAILKAKISIWQDQNNTDDFPTLKQLGIEERVVVKPGIQELFESNPELANAVYESLGFNKSTFDTNGITLSEETSIGWMFIQLNNKKIGRVKFVNNGEKGQLGLSIEINEEYQNKGYGQIVHILMADLAKKDYNSNLYSDYQNSSQEIQLLNSLVKRGYAEKIGDVGKSSEEYPDSFVTEERAFRIKTSDEIRTVTPQQKQQALQLYSQYLDSKGYKNIYYHYTNSDKKFDKFDKDKIGTQNLRNTSGVDTVSLVDNLKLAQAFGQFGLSVYSMSKEDINSFSEEYAKERTPNIVFVGINNEKVNERQIFKTELGNGFEINVENTEALDILGSKQDIEGFKEFTQGKFRKATLGKPEIKKGDIQKAEKYLIEKLGMTANEITRVQGLVDGNAFGKMLKNGKMILSEELEEGTEYHEAFHRVWNFYLTPQERNRLIEEFKSDPDYKSKIQYLKKSYEELDEDDLIEEYFAEDFRDFKLTGSKPSNIFEKIYQDIIDFLNKIFKASPKDIKHLYKLIDEGRYSKAKKLVENTAVDKNRSVSINSLELTSSEKSELLSSMDYFFSEVLFFPDFLKNKRGININNIFDFTDGNYTSEQMTGIYSYIKDKLLEALQESEELDKNTNATEILNAYDENPTTAFNNLIKEHLKRLSSFNLTTKEENESDIESNTENKKLSNDTEAPAVDPTSDENKEDGDVQGRSNLDIIPATEFNTKDNMPKSIKLLISSLPDTLPDGNFKKSPVLGLVQSGSWNNNVNILKNALATLPADIDIFIDKLTALKENYPQFQILLEQLGREKSEKFLNSIPINSDQGYLYDLRRAFVSEFALTKYNFYTALLNNKGTMLFLPSNKESFVNSLRTTFKANFDKAYSEFKAQRELDKSTEYFNAFKSASYEGKLKMLGIENYSGVSEEGFKKIKTNIDTIANAKGSFNIKNVYSSYDTKIKSIISTIADTMSDNTELQFMNIEGKPVYLINLNTYQTIVADTINYYIDQIYNDDSIEPISKPDKLNELLKEKIPHVFKSNQAQNSKWIQKILNGNKLEYALIEGLKVEELDKAIPISDLKEGDLLSLNINMTLNGLSPSQKHSDRSVFPVYKLGSSSNILQLETSVNGLINQATGVIQGYLVDEINKSKELADKYHYVKDTLESESNYKSKSFFSKIINYSTFKSLINGKVSVDDKIVKDSISKFLKDTVIQSDLKMFNEYKLNSKYEKTEGFGENQTTVYKTEAIGISNEVLEKYNNNWELLVSYAALDSFLQKYEQSILFVGDVTAYNKSKDLPKRLNTQSSTGIVSLIGNEIDSYVESLNLESEFTINGETYIYKEGYETDKIRELVIKDPAVKSYLFKTIRDSIREKLLKDFSSKPLENKYKSYEEKADVYATKYAKAYNEYTENDGFSYINIFMAREFEIRTNEWNNAKQTNFELQLKFINSGYDINSIKDDLTVPEDVEDVQEWLFKKYGPLTIKKPQYVGPNDFTTDENNTGVNIVGGRKTAYMPLMPTAIYDVALNAVHEFMLTNSIDVLHMEGAAKFGVKGLRDIYDKEGKWNLEEITEDQVGILPWKYMKNQVKISNIPKGKITSSTQARKNILEGFFDNGVPSDYPQGEERWNLLSDTQKKSESPIYKLIREYEKIQNTIINRSIESLLKELDATVYQNDDIKISVSKLRKVLVDSAKSRNSPDNVIEAAEDFLESIKYVEMIPNNHKIQPILNSLVTNRVLVQKRLGDMVPQAAVTGFESKPRKYNEDGTLDSDSDVLKFYEINEDGSISPAEIIIPITPDILKSAFTKYNTRSIVDAVQKLNEDIKTKGLEVIAKGLRIPNQQFSSNDVFKVKKFLLPLMQGIAVVPSELVAKTGGDFDIDKISLYYYHLDEEGNKIKYYETHTDELFDQFLEDKGVFKKQGDIKTDPNYKSFASRLANLKTMLSRLDIEATNEFIKYANETTGKSATNLAEANKDLEEKRKINAKRYDEIEEIRIAFGKQTIKQAIQEGTFLENFTQLIAEQKSLAAENRLIKEQIKSFETASQEEKDLKTKKQSVIKAIRTRKKNIKEAFREEFEATPVEDINSKEALDNRFLDVEIKMLLHPSQIKNLYSPVADTPLQTSKDTYVSKELMPMTDLFIESNNVELSIRFVSGKGGVGQLATWINFTDLAQRHGIKLNPEFPNVQIPIQGYLDKYDLGNNKDNFGESVSIVLSALLTSQVDLVKDPYAQILNIVNQTLDTVAYMVLRGVPVETIVNIVKHNGVNDFLKAERINQSLIIKATGKASNNNPLGLELSNDALKQQFIPESDFVPKVLTVEQIKLNSSKDNMDVLAMFLNLRDQAKEMNKIKRYYSPDTKYLKDRNSVMALKELFSEINDVEFPIITPVEQYKLISDNSILEGFYKGRELYDNLYKDFYFLDRLNYYQGIKARIAKTLYLTENDKVKFYNKIDQHLITFMLQKFYTLVDEQPQLYNFDTLLKGKQSLARAIMTLKKSEELKDNLFLQNIVSLLDNGIAKLDNFRSFKGKGTTSFINEQSDSFEELPEELQMLINIGNLFQSGTFNSIFQLNKFLPYDSQKAILSDVNDVISAVLSDPEFKNEVVNEFLHKFLLANKDYIPEVWKFIEKYNNPAKSLFPYAIENNNIYLVQDEKVTRTKIEPIGNYQGVDYRKEVPITESFSEIFNINTLQTQSEDVITDSNDLQVHTVKKVISGGQTGIDLIGLTVAKKLNIQTGGVAPKGYRTEEGFNLSLKEYGLTESKSSDYDVRTKENIISSDGTVLFGNLNSPGTKLTLKILSQNNKPFITNPTAGELQKWLLENEIKVLNVAGNRASKLSQDQINTYTQILIEALSNELVSSNEKTDIFAPEEGLKKINPYSSKPGVEPEVQDGSDNITIDNFDEFFPEYKEFSTDEKVQLLRAMSQEELKQLCKIKGK